MARVNPEDPAAADGDWIHGRAQLKVPMTGLPPVTRMPELLPLIEKNPALTVVIDHMADSPPDDPAKLDLLSALARYPRVFVKISHMWSLSKQAYPYADSQVQVKRLYDKFGRSARCAERTGRFPQISSLARKLWSYFGSTWIF